MFKFGKKFLSLFSLLVFLPLASFFTYKEVLGKTLEYPSFQEETLVLDILEDYDAPLVNGWVGGFFHEVKLRFSLSLNSKTKENLEYGKRNLLRVLFLSALEDKNLDRTEIKQSLLNYQKTWGNLARLYVDRDEDKTVDQEELVLFLEHYLEGYQILNYLGDVLSSEAELLNVMDETELILIKSFSLILDEFILDEEIIIDINTFLRKNKRHDLSFFEYLEALGEAGGYLEISTELQPVYNYLLESFSRDLEKNKDLKSLFETHLNKSGRNRVVQLIFIEALEKQTSLEFFDENKKFLSGLKDPLILDLQKELNENDYSKQRVLNYFDRPSFQKYRQLILLKNYLEPDEQSWLYADLEKYAAAFNSFLISYENRLEDLYLNVGFLGDIFDIEVLVEFKDFVDKDKKEIIDDLIEFHLETLNIEYRSEQRKDFFDAFLIQNSIAEPHIVRTIYDLKTPKKYDKLLVALREQSIEMVIERILTLENLNFVRALEKQVFSDKIIEKAFLENTSDAMEVIEEKKGDLDEQVGKRIKEVKAARKRQAEAWKKYLEEKEKELDEDQENNSLSEEDSETSAFAEDESEILN